MLKHADTILGKVINMSNLTQEEKPSAFAFTALVSNADDGFYRVIIFLSWLKSSILQIRAIIFNRSFSYLEELCTSIDRVQIRTVFGGWLWSSVTVATSRLAGVEEYFQGLLQKMRLNDTHGKVLLPYAPAQPADENFSALKCSRTTPISSLSTCLTQTNLVSL
jgi:hypothetical protein